MQPYITCYVWKRTAERGEIMKLPSMAYSNGMSSATQTSFAGLNHTPGAGDGELYHMENLTF